MTNEKECKDGVCGVDSLVEEQLHAVCEQGMFGELEMKDPTALPVETEE